MLYNCYPYLIITESKFIFKANLRNLAFALTSLFSTYVSSICYIPGREGAQGSVKTTSKIAAPSVVALGTVASVSLSNILLDLFYHCD